MSDGQPSSDPSAAIRHDIMNHVHVVVGNLELLGDLMPEERLVTDARDAAFQISRLLRQAWKA